jgi:hypothetical protein
MKKQKFKPLLVRLLPAEHKRLKKYANAQSPKQKMAHAVRELILNYCTDYEND